MLTDMVRPKRNEAELAAVAAELQAQRERDDQDVGFMGRLFTQFSLPYKDPGDDVSVWGRESGLVKITVQPGMTIDEGKPRSVGFPYGGVPRLILAHVSTEAVLTGEPRIKLGHSQSEFMRTVGLGRATGGRTGSIGRFQNQTDRLLRSTIIIDFKDPKKERSRAIKLNVASSWDLWWTSGRDRQPSLMQSTITLSNEFFREVIDHPVPVDMNVLNMLQSSPMAMDIYIWLTYRMFRLEDPYLISWPLLMLQFGSNLADTKQGRFQFKRDFNKHLEAVRVFYPELRVKVDLKAGLTLYPSDPHVLKRPARRLRALPGPTERDTSLGAG
ncbi:replication protein RepA [Nocardia sp. NBC_01327]|uniref:replication protein RepA n=1 Tax=Nocardia sp. NBC_01327 TaxID=2903593 RepID=UPI002E100240|nr:replication protein RepA [Nocardia sp. NBC_01327]